VFLLGRAGNRADALRTIIEQLNDVQQAMKFCKVGFCKICGNVFILIFQEHDEHALWNQLVAHAIRKLDALTTVLRTTGSHVPPGLIIAQIPPQMRVHALRESFVKIMHDYRYSFKCVRDYCFDWEYLLVSRTLTLSCVDWSTVDDGVCASIMLLVCAHDRSPPCRHLCSPPPSRGVRRNNFIRNH